MKKINFIVFFALFLAINFSLPIKVDAATDYYCKYKRAYKLSGQELIITALDGDNKVYVTLKTGDSIEESNVDVTKMISRSDIISNKCPSKVCYKDSTLSASSNCDSLFGNPFTLLNGGTSGGTSGGTQSYTRNPMLIGYTGDEKKIIYNTSIFNDLCSGNPTGVLKLLSISYDLLKIIAPVILVIFGMIDMAKAVTSSDEGKMKKAQGAFIRRIIAAIIVLLSFVIIEFVVKLMANGSDTIACLSELF